MSYNIDLSGRVAFVTGASIGLGAQFSKTLSAAGAGVVQTIAIPPNGSNNMPVSPVGIAFSAGIGRSIVTGSADNEY